MTYWLLEQLSEDTNHLIVNHSDTLQTRILQSFDLLLDDDLEGSGTDKEGWRRALSGDR